MNRNMTCLSPVESIYYLSTGFESFCAWCSNPLNLDVITKLEAKKKIHSTVQLNCGKSGCLIRNTGGENW